MGVCTELTNESDHSSEGLWEFALNLPINLIIHLRACGVCIELTNESD